VRHRSSNGTGVRGLARKSQQLSGMARDASEFLRRHKDSVASRWLEKLRAMRLEGELTGRQIMDSVVLFIDEVAAALLCSADGDEAPSCGSIAREHGRQRQELDVGLFALLQEYGLLLDAAVEVAHETGDDLTAASVHELSRYLMVSGTVAAHEYAQRELAHRRRRDHEQFAFIAHELRGPLSTVRLALDSVSDGLDEGVVRLITRNLERAAALIDDTIAHAKLETVGTAIQLDVIPVLTIVDDVVGDAAAMASARAMRISTEVPSTLLVHGDRRLLYSVVANLTRNAIKFSHHGARIHIAAREEEGRVLVEVADECGGLSVAEIQALFSAFRQTRTDRSGFGLGLALSKEAVEAHGGTLNVYNVEGVGCRFVVDLPADAPMDDKGARFISAAP
jgi:signal transduction histidine kinase